MLSSLIAVAATSLASPTLLDHSIQQWKRTPTMEIEDAYKWLFHATMGGEHAIEDESGPRAWMNREWKTLSDPFPGEVEVEVLTPDRSLLRINMRPYCKRGGSSEALLKAFVQSARSYREDRGRFLSAWNHLGARLGESPIGHLKKSDWIRLDHDMQEHGYPAIHHSEQYEKAYRPAYRVVSQSHWKP